MVPHFSQPNGTDLLGPELLCGQTGEVFVPLSFRHGADRVAIAAVVTIQVHLAKGGSQGQTCGFCRTKRSCSDVFGWNTIDGFLAIIDSVRNQIWLARFDPVLLFMDFALF